MPKTTSQTTNVQRHRDVSPKAPDTVTVCVTQKVKRGREAEFKDWLTGTTGAAEQFPGHQGVNIIHAAHSQEYTYIFRFDTYEHLQAWESSEEKANWVNKLRGLAEMDAKKQVLTGLEYWFALPNNSSRPAPPRYKMALLTVLAIYPLTTVLGYATTPGPFSAVRLLKGLAVSIIAVPLMTYVVMPRVTRLFARWLFGEKET
jgi:uncharacterized protein